MFAEGTETEKIVSFLDKVCADQMEKIIDKSYDNLGSYINSFEQKMVMKRENLADKALWTAKKRYILNVYDSRVSSTKNPNLK